MSLPPDRIGDWRVDWRAGRLTRGDTARHLEPKVVGLLRLLASEPGRVFGREEIFAAVWPGVTVGDDTLSRCLSKLRTALGDDPKAVRYIETLSKRGYRLIAEVGSPAPQTRAPRAKRPLVLAALAVTGAAIALAAILVMRTPPAIPLLRQADDFYFQYSRADNEAARVLYERVIAAQPENAAALAGLANTLTQTVIRWPDAPGGRDYSRTTLGEALSDGRTRRPQSVARLARARALAERAVALEPDNAPAHQALGLVAAAQGDFARAQAAYDRAIALDPDAWGALINRGDLMEIRGDRQGSIVWFERAYGAMGRIYDRQAPRVRPWRAETGVLIARRYREAGRLDEAERWYRQVLDYAPFHPGATGGLAALLAAQGDRARAADLCRDLVERIGPDADCGRILAGG